MNRTLAERAAACKRFRWLPGMRVYAFGGWERLDSEWIGDWRVEDIGTADGKHGAVPDLDDPLTVLALLLLVRKAYGNPRIYFEPAYLGEEHGFGMWGWRLCFHGRRPDGPASKTLAECLIVALERAP